MSEAESTNTTSGLVTQPVTQMSAPTVTEALRCLSIGGGVLAAHPLLDQFGKEGKEGAKKSRHFFGFILLNPRLTP